MRELEGRDPPSCAVARFSWLEVATPRCLSGSGGFVFEEAEAGGLEDGAVAEPAQPLVRVVVGRPGRRPVGKRVQAVRLGVAEGHAQPREVVGDATRARGLASLMPRILAVPTLWLPGRADQRDRERTKPVGVDVGQLQHARNVTRCPKRTLQGTDGLNTNSVGIARTRSAGWPGWCRP